LFFLVPWKFGYKDSRFLAIFEHKPNFPSRATDRDIVQPFIWDLTVSNTRAVFGQKEYRLLITGLPVIAASQGFLIWDNLGPFDFEFL
jgi:hypothetical protein